MSFKFIAFIKSLKSYQALASIYKAKREAEFAFSNKTCPPIFIYTMGKVGSTTVHNSLVDASIPNAILHLHFLSQNLPRHRQLHKESGIFPLPDHIYLGEATRSLLIKNNDFPVKIISLVRDPIAFIVSNLFEVPQFAKESILNAAGSIDPRKAAGYINRKIADPDAFGYVYNWFDKELKAVFDIDVFANPFPLEAGYAIYRNSNVEALVIRLEDLSKKGPQAIADFMGLEEPLILKDGNIRAKLTEKTAYQEVLETVSLDPEMCRKIYSSNFVKHFYSESMINTFIAKWTKSSS